MDKNKSLAVVDKMPVEKYKTKPTEDLVEHIIQDIESMLVERLKTSRENTMLAFWETGEIIRNCEKENKINVSALVDRLAMDNRITGRQMGARNIWFALKVFDTYPKFEKLYDTEHGENITVSKLKKMLTAPKPKKEKTVHEIAVDIVNRLGVEKSEKLANKILKLCKDQD